MNKRFKFTLTQISALIPASAGLSIALLYARYFMMVEEKPKDFPFFTFGIFVIIMLVSIFSLFKIWAWMLVKCNILTNEEAKGYPYSKPWELDKLR